MNLKKEAIRTASIPLRSVKTLDKAVTSYKPISVHKSDVSFYSLDFILKLPSRLISVRKRKTRAKRLEKTEIKLQKCFLRLSKSISTIRSETWKNKQSNQL